MSDEIKTNGVETPVEGEEPPKTAKQLEKEAKKAAKLAKLQEKLDKKAAAPVSKKEKPEVSEKLYIKIMNEVFFFTRSTASNCTSNTKQLK